MTGTQIVLSLLILVAAASAASAQSDARNPEWLALGTYACATDRIVAIRDEPAGSDRRYAGAIAINDNWKKFSVTTSKRKTAPACRANLAKGEGKWRPRELWFHCDSAYQADFGQSLAIQPMRGDWSNSFEGELWERFNISATGRFVMFRGERDGWYLHEGRCQKS
jgi:hypothetical protein